MDGYSGKRAVDGMVVPKKGSGLILRDTVNSRERNAQYCNRMGCSGRLNSMKSSQIGCSEKAKCSRPSYRSPSNGKEIVGSSSGTNSVAHNDRKCPKNPPKKLSPQLETDSSETSSIQDEPEVPELIPPPGKIQRGLHTESEHVDSHDVASVEVGSPRVASNPRSRKNFNQRSVLGNQDNLPSSSISTAPRSTINTARTNGSRYGLSNLRCNSIPDVVPSGCSSSESSLSRRNNTLKKRFSDGESSSSTRGKKMNGVSLDRGNYNSGSSISISDSRRAKNWPVNRDGGAASVRTRRSSSSLSRGRLPNQGDRHNLSLNESPHVRPQAPPSEVSIDLNASISTESAMGHASSYNRPGSSGESLRNIMQSRTSDVGVARSLMNRDSFRHYNVDGIAEVLLALERIEQDEELTYEQLLILETSLFLNGLHFHDQHRDMRLDIDNMSYEELLALEERMGTVSTALSEESLSKCLRKSIYESDPLEEASINCKDVQDDVKCSICQEEYAAGDEVGRLHCEHRYHVVCIQQWLRLKNWCPICKAAAEPSPSSSPPPSIG